MSIKYEIHFISNAQGTGKKRNFARVFEQTPMTAKQLKSQIQASCSLTEGDVDAALSALREQMLRALSDGQRFYIPGIGYFSLSVDMQIPEGKSIDKMRGDYIQVRNIKFRPEASLLRDIRNDVKFERATYSTRSKIYSENALWEGLKAHFTTHDYIVRSDMEILFGLRRSAALKWLKHFTDKGMLRKGGAVNSPVYFMNE